MKVRALRGVCIGVERHLALGETADLEAPTAAYLVSIGAVAPVADPVPAPVEIVSAPAAEPESPAKAGTKKEK
jgi:hypothetical protein